LIWPAGIAGGVTEPGLFVPQSDEGSEKAWPRQDPELAAAGVTGPALLFVHY